MASFESLGTTRDVGGNITVILENYRNIADFKLP